MAISAYHYALASDKDEEGNVIKNYKTFLINPDGEGTNYSEIAYVKDPIEYIWGENVGKAHRQGLPV